MVPRIGKWVGAAAFGLCCLHWSQTANAQVVTDGTLGPPAQALAGPNYAIDANLGQQLGGNLFHSFSQFNVGNGQSATFSGPASVSNILSRVTGGTASSINGLVRSTIAGANLYLLNPKGIMFGPNAALDVQGSFHASTADYLKLGTDGRFDATNPGASVLTSAPPSAFGFLGPPGPITVNDSVLAQPVPVGASLSLIGGEISISDYDAAISAPGARINIVSVAGPGEIGLAPEGIVASADQGFGSIRITGAFIDTSTSGNFDGGAIHVRGGRIVIDALGWLFSGALPGSTGAGGTISVQASTELIVTGSNPPTGERSAVSSLSRADGRAGDIRVRAPRVVVDDGAFLGSITEADGAAGSIEIDASRVEVLRGATIATPSLEADGAAGALTIRASESVLIQGSGPIAPSRVSASAFATGAAGAISIVTPRLTVDGGEITTTTTSPLPAGAITIDAGRVEILNGALVHSATFGDGAGGPLVIRAGESMLVQGSNANGIASTVSALTGGAGAAGSIAVTTPVLTLNGGNLASPTAGAGNAGAITVDVGRVEILQGGQINSETLPGSTGAGGVLTVRASESVLLQGRAASGLESRIRSSTSGSGTGGSISIAANAVTLGDGASIAAESTGTGFAGTISIDAGASLRLSGGSSITTQALSADGGNIGIRARDLVHVRDSDISTAVGSGFGDGGNITIDPTFVVLQNGFIIANAFGGNGGNISIVSQFFLTDPLSRVQASSQLGVSGSVLISAPEIDLSSTLSVLSSAFFDASALLRESCAARAGRANSFVPTGRGGLTAQPEGIGFSDYAAASAAAPRAEWGLRLAHSGCPTN